MTDEVDRAFDQTELFIKQSLRNAEKERVQLKPKGTCHNCGDETPAPHLFCLDEDGNEDRDCRADYFYRVERSRVSRFTK